MEISKIEETLKNVERIKTELDQAAVHLENALFLENKIKWNHSNSEELIKQQIEKRTPPGIGMERR